MKEGNPLGSGKSVDDARVGTGGASLSRISGLERNEAKKREQGRNDGHGDTRHLLLLPPPQHGWPESRNIQILAVSFRPYSCSDSLWRSWLV